jgi:predicted neuraminidase
MLETHYLNVHLPGRPTCHCASLTELPDGDLLAVWYAGAGEGLPDSALLSARYSQPESQWTIPETIVDTPGLSDGNAILFTAPGGAVWLVHTVIQGHGWDTVQTYWRQSLDGGLSWSGPRLLDGEAGLMVRCRPLQLSSGRLLVPMYDEKDWSSFCLLSDDGGFSWRRSVRLQAPEGCIQPAVVERADGSLLAHMRCGNRVGHVWQATSLDGGENWSPCTAVDLPNPNSGLDLIRLPGGELLLAANLNTASRSPLHLALSPDEGETWPCRLIVAHDPGEEFSYPQLLQDRQGRCHLLYTWRRERIRHLAFDGEWLAREAGRQGELDCQGWEGVV